jgi:predicted transcriptional regulator
MAEESKSGTSILLRLSPDMATHLRRLAKTEERTITTVVTRALREYFKTHHNVEIEID